MGSIFIIGSSIHIYYLDSKNEFDANRKEAEVYTNDRVDFNKVAKLPFFLHGIRN